MLSYLINLSVKNKFIVILLSVFVIGFGLYSLSQIPIGAVPDVTNNQVQVITTSRNLSTQDIEQFITYPVELEMANLPGVQEIRSISKFGLSVVTIVFDDDMGTFLPRQLIAEKIKSTSEKIPEGFGTPEMGPVTTGLGEIYQYVLDAEPAYKDRYTTQDLHTIQDWIVRVHGDIENENYIFLTGMFVEADIITETAMAFAVPSRAVVETDSNLYVLVLEKE